MEISKQSLMASIVKKIEEFENEFIHLKIFNVLTDNGTLKNFSDNRNGIFFELNTFEYSKLKDINSKLDYYRTTSENAQETDKSREQLVDKMKKTVAGCLPRSQTECNEDAEDQENLNLKAYNDDNSSDCSILSDGELFGEDSENDSDCYEER